VVEYKRDGSIEPWRYANDVLTPEKARFYGFAVRIDGVEHDTYTAEFEIAFNKATMWNKLKEK